MDSKRYSVHYMVTTYNVNIPERKMYLVVNSWTLNKETIVKAKSFLLLELLKGKAIA